MRGRAEPIGVGATMRAGRPEVGAPAACGGERSHKVEQSPDRKSVV